MTPAAHSSPRLPPVQTARARSTPCRLVVAMPREVRERVFGTGCIFPAHLPTAIAVVEPPDGDAREWEYLLNRLAPEILVSGWGTPALPASWLEAPGCSLCYLCHSAGSVRALVPRGFLERGGQVSNWGTLVARAVAEQALLLALGALRDLPAWRERLSGADRKRQNSPLATRTLSGKRVGIHGFGAIARELVRLLRPFDVRITVHASNVPVDTLADYGLKNCLAVEDLCRRSDVFFECEALTPATEGSLSAKAIGAFAPGSVLVNVGRGRVVDEAALLEAARSGHLRVAVDVVSDEPIKPDSPWLDVEGVLVSPHLGGPTQDQMGALAERVVKNVTAYLAGAPLKGAVTLEIYDRST